jgi:hypothetical protein
MYEFTRTRGNGTGVDKTTKIQLIVPENASAETHIVRNFYGSAVINIISWDMICCVFPRTTVHERRMQVLRKRELTKREGEAILKYEQRGFESVAWNDMDIEEKEFSEARSVGDRMCWNVPLREVKNESSSRSGDKKRKRQEEKHGKSTKTRRILRFGIGRSRVLLLR